MSDATDATMATYLTQLAECTRKATLAASLASDATAELLRFHLEGPRCNWPFGDADPLQKLAEAILHAARIEATMLECQPSAADYLSSLNQLAGAASKFLDEQGEGDPLNFDQITEEELPF